MPVNSTQNFSFKLVANGTTLDLFKGEDILLSDNVTGLFDLGVLPSDFTRQITLPGTKTNNAFFEHVYDISIESPFLFETNVKVPCYLDFDGIYLADGYLQLNKVTVIANKFIDSYEISIYGGLSSFARDINRYYLTDLTASLAQYNHTASLQNITGSWEGNLFNGDIVYPFAEYGQALLYSPELNKSGIDESEGAMCVQDYKPAIRLKKVWDAVFSEFGYTYSSSFFNEPFIDDIYMICNYGLKYPIFQSIDLETYGLCRFSPFSGSGQTEVILNVSQSNFLPWFKIESNPSGLLSNQLIYTVETPTKLRGSIGINMQLDTFKIGGTTIPGNGVPQFTLAITSNSTSSLTPLDSINDYFLDVYNYNQTITRDQTVTVTSDWQSELLPTGSYTFNLNYSVFGDNNFYVVLNPANTVNSYLEVKKVNQAGDGLIMNIADNMPYGTTGIKLIDFITSVQKKFNLVIYPSKTKQREFIVEPFVNWYKQGQVKDFNKFINLDEPIEVIPANNLAVNELNFGDTLDRDYISQQFNDAANREFGKTYYVDTDNFFSQGKFEVQSGFASTPLVAISGTGASGSAFANTGSVFTADATAISLPTTATTAECDIKLSNVIVVNATATSGTGGGTVNDVDTVTTTVSAGQQVFFTAVNDGDGVMAYLFEKETDSGNVTLASGIIGAGAGTRNFIYNVTVLDTTSTVLEFRNIVTSEVV
jgi:hypothetical protein